MKLFKLINVFGALFFCTLLGANEIAGVSEVITLLPDDIQLHAKLDTGADNSSIDAQNIEYFTKNGDEWVRFTLPRSLDKKDHVLEYPLIGTTKIASRVPAESKKGRSYHSRPVINMDVCIGDEERTIEVNLFDRSNFSYPFLMGASGLKEFNFLVDVRENDLFPSKCTAGNTAQPDFKYYYFIILLLIIVITIIALVAYKKLMKRKERV
jgi:hypothetical protein